MNDMVENTMKKATRSRLSALTLLVTLLVAAPAFAQDSGETPAESVETPAESVETEEQGDAEAEEEGADDVAEAPDDSGSEEATSEPDDASTANTVTLPSSSDPLEGELQRYWSSDRDLATIEDKLFTRDGKIGIGIHTGLMSSEPFWWYLPVGLRASYNFSDQAGVEVGGQYLIANKTDLLGFFESRNVETFDPDTDLEDKMMWRANASFVWSPLYGKWAFLNNKITHFDFNLAVGAGVVGVNRPNVERTEASSAIEPELVFGPGAHFFLTENWLLRADGRFYVYRGAETDTTTGFFDRLQMPIEFLLGGTYLF